jgi:TonB-dependent SusC/RagA subfamily outer membrane receptor
MPINGATITAKNTKVVALTNDKGNFSIDIPAGSKMLVVTFVGMETSEVNVANKTSVTVSLKSTASALADVVVIGYGTVKKSDLTGSAQRLNREDIMRDNPGNILQAMQGKLAGVNVTQNDGAPGAGLSIRIRGSNSFLGGTEPLYVIDGVPFNNSSSGTTPESLGGDEKQTLNALAFLNPNDIESIDVLKDASATAIYGSRGANGVVLITTKRGKSGKTKFSLNVQEGTNAPTGRRSFMNATEFVDYFLLAAANDGKYNYIGNGKNYSSILNGSGNTINSSYSTILNGSGNIIGNAANNSSIITKLGASRISSVFGLKDKPHMAIVLPASEPK